jgi:UTP--glucose-1-phosphate uridylyltransferase
LKKIRKAVFPVAGFGTRFLPATKAMPKELLPIVDKPLIQYAVEEAIEAGIDTLIFITGRHKRAIEDHFDTNYELEQALKERGKYDQANMVHNILPKNVECIFVRQPQQLGLGHAVLCAERVVGDEPFAVLLADDFITQQFDNGTKNKGTMTGLVKAFEKTGKTQLSVMEVNGSEISNYGVIQKSEKFGNITGLIEKPPFAKAPSNLASIGRYVLQPEIFQIIRNQKPGFDGEIQLADALNLMAQDNRVATVPMKGKRFDCGSVRGYLDAILHLEKNWKK